MGALLDQPPVFQHYDLAGNGGGGKAMGDEDGGLVTAQGIKLAEDLLLGNGVQRGGGLIQNKDVRIAVKGARHRQLLPLTAG